MGFLMWYFEVKPNIDYRNVQTGFYSSDLIKNGWL
ncbi:hypothetical protein HMPREF9138_01077 [Prevotella histicola F0411]|uniref:Uncharacterized protein n=1 Tax=Prevotella histicola F0411 TaxID=857291 RepID=G6AG50_9BACT|nr:hypothetical protein HMPREF9138_01077 [Prevotella histicola F0411]